MKGAISKKYITDQILTTFPNSFQYGKELRIPMMEEGSLVEIKVVLTCAKENISTQSVATDLLGLEINFTESDGSVATMSINHAKTQNLVEDMDEPTEQEKQRVQELMNKLGI